jgi:NO-binding membrane sensor protein with MHYT domain
MLRVIGCITQQHDLRLVALAACICVLACGTTLNLLARAQATKKQKSLAYLAAASAVFGCGVWSLHFVAMLAFISGVPIAHGVPMTIASVLVAVIGALMALSVWLFCPSKPIGVIVGGTLLGLSVSAMHYCGVMAMQGAGTFHLDQNLVIASIAVSVTFAVLTLARFDRLVSKWRRMEAAGWLALSVCGLHFTGMAALSIELGQPGSEENTVLGSGTLAVTVGTVSLAILIVSLAATLMEQRLSQRAVLELKRMRLLSDMSQEVLILHRDGIILLGSFEF